MTLYHVTPDKNVKSILKKGLIPDGAFDCLSENPYSWWRRGLIILEVNIDGLNIPMRTWQPGLDEITVWGIIPPRRIRISKLNRQNNMKKNLVKDANDYQRKAHSFACYGENPTYAFSGLAEEAGEALGKYAKFIRKHEGQEPSNYSLSDLKRIANKAWKGDNLQFREDLKAELSDICWFIAEICTIYGLKFNDVLEYNIDKLEKRRQTGTIIGSGDTIEERLKNR